MKNSANKILMLFLCITLSFLAKESYASHYRYGAISWQKIQGSTNTVQFKVQQAWRRSAFGQPNVGQMVSVGSLNFGDGSGTGIRLVITSIDPANDIMFGEFIVQKTYSAPGNYLAFYQGCCRIGGLANNSNGNFRNETVVNIGNTNNSPVSTLNPIINLQQNLTNASFSMPVTDPDNDPLSYRLANCREVISTGSSSCNPNPPQVSVSNTGIVTMNTTGQPAGRLFSVMIVAEDGQTKTINDFLIRIVQQSTPPQFDYTATPANGFNYQVSPGSNVNFNIKAFDNDPGNIVTLTANGLPQGASFTPVAGSSGNPITYNFNWTAGSSQLGTSVINFTAQDNNGVQTQTSVSIINSLNPVFDVPPTPAESAHIVSVPGQNITFKVQASDPDPADLVEIFDIKGKDMSGNPIPVYSGVSFNTPTAQGNPTSGNFSWTPTPAQWGHRHLFFYARDTYNGVKRHEVSVLVNTNPQITSNPATTVVAGAAYTYNVTAVDPDLAFGDQVALFAINLPSFLSFTDNGNGTGSLMGTPTIADAGTYQIEIEAQDLNHHQNVGGIPRQSFMLEVIPCSITLSATASDASCLNSNDGSIDLTVNGATAPITYSWFDANQNQVATVEDPNGLGAGIYSVQLTDANNCSETLNGVVVNWVDNVSPIVSTQAFTVQLNANATASITAADVNSESTDNCGIDSLYLDRYTFGCSDIGVQTVMLTVIDNSGNSASAPATLTVLAPPAMSLSPVLENGGEVYSNFDGSFTATFGYNNNNACPLNIPIGPDNNFTPSPADRGQGTSFLTGRQQNTFTTMFYSGNLVWRLKSPDGTIRTATATAPSGRVRPILEYVVDNGNGTYTAHFGYLNENNIIIRIPVGPNNNFSPGNAVNNQPIEFNPGRHYDVFTVNLANCQSTEVWTLQSPNSAAGTATAAPNDQTPPTVATQNFTAQLDASGNALLNAIDVDGGSSDFCGIASYSITSGPSSYNCADVGNTYQVELTVTDINGLSASGFANVSVSDSNLSDNDNDNISDVCDPDDDNDGILDSIDKYPFDASNNGKGVILAYVWDDLNGNGIQDAGEPAVQGIPIKLYSNSNKLLAETSTEAEGLAAFFDLKEGQKVKMEFQKQNGQAFTHKNVGGNDALDSDVNSKNGKTSLIKIKASQILTDVDAGIWSEGSILTKVWEDQNGNGIQDTNEPPIPGVLVRLMTSRNQILYQTRTDANGTVQFYGVPANENRRLQFVAPPNYYYTTKDEGSNDNLDSDANQGDGKTAPFRTTQGAQLITDVDAGLIAPSFARLSASNDEESISEFELELFPNPVKANLNLKISSQKQEQAVFMIFDLMGKKVMEKTIVLQEGENKFNFDFSSGNLADGHYILTIYPNSQPMMSKKFIKE